MHQQSMTTRAFVSPAAHGLGARPAFRGNALTARRAPAANFSAVLGTRTGTVAGFGTDAPAVDKFVVKVMQKDRCTLVECDRDTDLRRALLAAKVDVYTLVGKLKACGGAGQCGTCIVAVEDGLYSTNARTPKEEFLLQGKPPNFRLACRTMIHGDLTIRTKPKA